VTALYCSGDDYTRMYSGHMDGSVQSWQVVLDNEHWIKDSEVKICQSETCNNSFSLIVRKHHCRVCGGVFCGSCTSHRAAMPELGFQHPVRVCDGCHEELALGTNGSGAGGAIPQHSNSSEQT